MTKRFMRSLAVLLAAVMLFSALPFTASAAETEQSVGATSGTTGDCTWTLDDDGTLTISGNGAMEDYRFGYDYAFSNKNAPSSPWGTNISSVIIENGVTRIGDGAFDRCTSLTSVTIPGSVTSIGGGAFGDCSSLTGVYINDIAAWCRICFLGGFPGNPLNYAHNLYLNNELVTDLIVPDSVTSIGDYAFAGCTGLTGITIPDSVTSIGISAFDGCTGLTGITIPGIVTGIGNYAFDGCPSLTDVTIGNGVTRIGIGAFCDCTSLTGVTIPDSVTSIGIDAFYNTAWYNNQPDGLVYAGKVAYTYKGTMPSGTSIVLKNGTNGIADGAFSERISLTGITIPDSVTNIGDSAFIYCTNLTNVAFGSGVTSIGSAAFYDTAWYNNQPDGLVYAGKVAYAYKGDMPSDTSIVLENGTKGIAGDAFWVCTTLTGITIPDSVTNIGYGAFCYCKSLIGITIPDGVTYIGALAFSDCTNLTSITIPKSVKCIRRYAFSGCTGLTRITIPDSAARIEANAFFNCTSLKSVTIPESVTDIGDKAFGYFSEAKKTEGFTVYGKAGSAAESYAKSNGFRFISGEEPAAAKGDANLDGSVDVKDVTEIQRGLAEYTELSVRQTAAADVDGNGTVTVADATLLQMYLAEFDVELG